MPVRIDKVDPPLGFGETQALDLHGWKGDRSDPRYQAVLPTLRKRLGIKRRLRRDPRQPAAGSQPPHGDHRRRASPQSRRPASAPGSWRGHSGERGDSIAVLPFANLSGDPEQSLFFRRHRRGAPERPVADRRSESCCANLVRSGAATTTRKTAAQEARRRQYPDRQRSPSPSTIRVSAQLVDGQHGLERWSRITTAPPATPWKIQTDIADKVAEALSIRLGGADRERLAQGGTNNPEAHDLLLKAEQYQKDESRESVQRAIGVVDAALALDPKYGDAWSTKAQLLSLRAGRFSMNAAQFRAGYGAAEEIARKAIQVAPQSRRGYAALGEILDQQLKRRAAFVQFRKMLALSGEEGRTLPIYATFLSEIGRSGEALQAADQAIALDPLNSRSYGRKAAIFWRTRDDTQTLSEILEKAAQLSPGVKGIASFRAYCLAMSGRTAEARRELSATFGDPADAPPGWAASLLRGGSDPALGERLLAGLRESYGGRRPLPICADLRPAR